MQGINSLKINFIKYRSASLQKLIGAITLLSFVMSLIGIVIIVLAFAKSGATDLLENINLFPLIAIVFSFLGFLILQKQTKHLVGWLFLFIGADAGFTALLYSFTFLDQTTFIANPTLLYLGNVVGNMAWWPVLILPFTLVILYFPDGKLLSRKWQIVAIATLLGLLFGMLTAFHSEPILVGESIPGISVTPMDVFLESLAKAAPPLILIGGLGSMASVYFKFRQSTGVKRMQMKWLLWGGSVFLLLSGIHAIIRALLPYNPTLVPINNLIGEAFTLIIPITCGIAIIRHRLWDINIVINRTLVYGILTALIIGIYALIVGGLGLYFQTQNNALIGLVAAGVIAVLFQPLRLRLQRRVNRMLFGERDDPATVLTRLALHPETAETLSTGLLRLVKYIADILKIPYVAIRLPNSSGQMERAAHWGEERDPAQSIELSFQNEKVGELLVASRSPQEQFNQDEQDLLAAVGAISASTIRAMQLSTELRRSRQQIITAREEERRRIRRDLHDGLGPQLASQVLGLEAVDQLMDEEPEKARQLLKSLKTQSKEAILDVRRLVYDLRPPALDDLGLIGALRQSASRYETDTLHFSFDVPPKDLELPAAVETAAFRILQEAMTNVVHHAKATECKLRLYSSEGYLDAELQDNGRGLSNNFKKGVGLQAMEERATELNGEFTVKSPQDGGTLVFARLPLEA